MTFLSRRHFLKATSLASTGIIMGKLFSVPAYAKAHPEDKATVLTACRWGPLLVETENGKIKSSKSALAQTVPNSLQTTAHDQAHTTVRVKYPMVRKGYLANPEKPEGVRGRDEFVRVSWEEALDLIHQQHQRIRKSYGAKSIFAGSYGWRSTGSVHKARTLLQRYMGLAGGYTAHLGDYSTAAAQVILPYVVGSIEVYEQQTAFPVVLEHSDVVVLWGLNPMNTLKIAWSCTDGQGLEFFHQLKASGKTIIAIDPMKSETIEFLSENNDKNVTWIAPHPSTDVAMMLGIAYHLVKENLVDRTFLDKYTVGYDKFEAYLLGQTDNTPKTPEWAEKICGVPAKQMEILAKLFTQHRTMLMAGWGIQRQQYGEQRHWMLVTLAAMLGQIGLPGGGFGFSYHYSNGGNPTRDAGIAPSMSTGINGFPTKGAVERIPVARLVEALERPNETYQHNGQEKTFPEIKMIWWAGGANFTHHQDTNRLIRAWQKPELIVISEPYWTAAAKHADIVLPITTSFERNDITMTGDYSNQHLVPMKQVIKPQFEAKSDFEVFSEMAERLMTGGKGIYTENKTEMMWINHFYNEAQKIGRANRIPMPNFSLFWQQNKLIEMRYNEKNAQFVRYQSFREDPILNPLGTPSGKIEIYSQTIEGFHYDDCPPHPTWLEPTEYVGNAKEGELQLMTSHAADRLHSQLNYAKLRDNYAIANREPIWINPVDAEKHGIQTGDLVKAFNAQGAVLVGALVTERIKQGSVCIHEGAWVDLDPMTGICRNGSCNVLTKDIPTSRLGNGCAGNAVLVRIEKYEGEIPGLEAFNPPKNA